jgi:hypothetical protein
LFDCFDTAYESCTRQINLCVFGKQVLERIKLELARFQMDHVDLVSARVQNSVGLKFFCQSSTAYRLFERRLASGQLKHTIETIFNALLTVVGAAQGTSGPSIDNIVSVVDISVCNQDSIQRSGQ